MAIACLLCVLLIFISSGETLLCIDCRDFSGNFCSGKSVTCPADSDVCMSTLVQYDINFANPEIQNIIQSLGAISPLTFVRGCGYSEECTEVVALRTPNIRTVTSSKCCKSDLCTPEIPTAHPEAPKNSLTCPGCFQITTNACPEYTPVQCRGDEDQCFSYTNLKLYDNVTIAMSGCATKTACNLDLQEDTRKTLCTGGIVNGDGGVCSSPRLLLFLLAAVRLTMSIY